MNPPQIPDSMLVGQSVFTLVVAFLLLFGIAFLIRAIIRWLNRH